MNKILRKLSLLLLTITVSFSMSGISSFAASGDTTVYVTKTGKCYHSSGCSSLSKSCIETTLESASAKYSPCSKCKPPTLDANTSTTQVAQKASTSTKSNTTSKSTSTKKSTSTSKKSTSSKTKDATKKAAVSKQSSAASNETKDATVWISATGTKYHSKNNCGKMNPDKATSMSESDAKAAGFSACSKCCK